MKKNNLIATVFAMAALSASAITPQPSSISFIENAKPLKLGKETTVRIIGAESSDSIRLAEYMSAHDFTVVPTKKKAQVSLSIDQQLGHEAYNLHVNNKGVSISASSGAGLFYGIQTLMDLRDDYSKSIPALSISDSPRFAYRGMMLDISRHPRDKEFILKQIRAMERLNLNRLHLHLTDAAGWRIESEKYPRLNTVASWRPEETWKEWNAGGNLYGGTHGGFLTKEELKEIVDYAADRYITVIPEVEMPSHSEEVFAAYPMLSCTHTDKGCSNFCAGSEATFEFIQELLDEVLEIFPSEYIHIGGDEAPKGQWTECDACRKRMADEGLASPEHLQSYFIRRIQDYLSSKGRKAIVWDDALEGDGPSESAVIMSWRGTEPSSVSLPVILSPGRYCYLDSYQDAPSTQPEAIGGYTSLSTLYDYDPDPAAVGFQGNLWCEYIPTDSHAEYMLYPRMLAVAETAWTPAERKNADDFRRRAISESERMRTEGFTVFDLNTEVGNRPEAQTPVDHLAKGKKVTYLSPYWKNYPAGGDSTLVDGLRGGWNYSDRLWQGFLSADSDERVAVLIDLGAETPIQEISATFMQICGPDVWFPEHVTIYAGNDPDDLTELTSINHTQIADTEVSFRDFGWKGSATARYVRYRATAAKGVIFIDEIIVR